MSLELTSSNCFKSKQPILIKIRILGPYWKKIRSGAILNNISSRCDNYIYQKKNFYTIFVGSLKNQFHVYGDPNPEFCPYLKRMNPDPSKFPKNLVPFSLFFCLQKNDLPFNVKLRRVVFIFYLFFFNGGLKSLVSWILSTAILLTVCWILSAHPY